MQPGDWKSGCVLSGSPNSSNNKNSVTAPYSLIRMRLPETELNPAQLHMLCSATRSKEESPWRKFWSQWSWYSSAAKISYFVCFNQKSEDSKPCTLTTEHYAEQIGLFVAITIHWCKQRLPQVSSYESGRFDYSLATLPREKGWKRIKLFNCLRTWRRKNSFYSLKKVFSCTDTYKTTKEIHRKD